MASELLPTSGDIRPHGHLKLGRFTQHFVDVLDLERTPLEFFEATYPNDPREEQRKYLGRFGVSGPMQVQKMAELSDGQKSRVVFAKLGRDVPHIVSITKQCRSNPLPPKKEHLDLMRRAFPFGSLFDSPDPFHSCSSTSPRTIWIWNVSPAMPNRPMTVNPSRAVAAMRIRRHSHNLSPSSSSGIQRSTPWPRR